MDFKDYQWLSITWHNYVNLIKWKIQERNSNNQKVKGIIPSINISIIISCCTLIEGYLYTIIKDYIFIAQTRNSFEYDNRELLIRILNDYTKQLDRASFEKYLEIFEVFTGIIINKSIKENTWKATKLMFQYRNLLVHGNEIEFKFREDKTNNTINLLPDSKFNSILEYGKEKKLILIDYDNKNIDLLTNKFVDHFFIFTKQFIIEVHEAIPQNLKSILTADLFNILNDDDKSL